MFENLKNKVIFWGNVSSFDEPGIWKNLFGTAFENQKRGTMTLQEFLREKGIQVKFERNLANYMAENETIHSENGVLGFYERFENDREAITEAFIWARTPEGHGYWRELSGQWKDHLRGEDHPKEDEVMLSPEKRAEVYRDVREAFERCEKEKKPIKSLFSAHENVCPHLAAAIDEVPEKALEKFPEFEEEKPKGVGLMESWWEETDRMARIEALKQAEEKALSKCKGSEDSFSSGNDVTVSREQIIEQYERSGEEGKRTLKELYPNTLGDKEEYLKMPVAVTTDFSDGIAIGDASAPDGMIKECIVLDKTLGEWVLEDHPKGNDVKILYCETSEK